MNITESDKVRFWAKANTRGDHECWPWLSSFDIKSGYGSFWLDGRARAAHVASLLIKLNKNELGELALHTCDNRLCCNPKHLYEGSYQQNTYDKLYRGRKIVGTGKGINHHNASLSQEQVDLIIKRRSEGETFQEIANDMLISRKTVSRVWSGERYR